MRNILITISYNGKYYHGWQIQANSLTVQEVFQKALRKIVGNNIDLKGCSRTDSGVHANMYCISARIEHNIACNNLLRALNRYLPSDISVLDCREVSDEFHARYSCTGKEYVYKIWNDPIKNPFLDGYAYHYWYKLDEKLLDKAAKYYIGEHDFTSFCTLDRRDRVSMTRTVFDFSVTREGSFILMTVSANGFLYNMVRIMVGTLLKIVQGKLSVDSIPEIINAKDRSKAGPTAVACGLYLNRVFYEEVNIYEEIRQKTRKTYE